MDEKQQRKVLEELVGLVVWYGEEQNLDYVKRLERVRKLCRKIAPEELQKQLALVKAQYD